VNLTTAQLDRARGMLLATAAGDALGAGYEFGPPLPPDAPVMMKGGGSFDWEPGEWTDDTAMALVIAQTAASGADLRTARAQDAVTARWADWAAAAKDVGNQTRAVLGAVTNGTAAEALAASRQLHDRTGHTAGNGSLMRTAPVALAYLGDPGGLTEAAAALSALTHYDQEAGEACVLWCHAIRHAVLTGDLDARAGLGPLPEPGRARWAERLTAAEHARTSDFTSNGWVVEALQAAWCAIATATVPVSSGAGHLRAALENAVRGGRDADTVAAIAGGLLGAAHGTSAVPAHWQRELHGWPGLTAADLTVIADAAAAGPP
jgi:ADP-ribosylglycohydrolase